ncbi:MAG: 50S ribosomal protein L16 [Candidatus Yanofskybacteria bacterium CG10_big_fil_rev_8_21_14_0_10_36_16]|uniref:Large ribosomal subunit protein uL16 n=1 Tax=Candidatus Yanofskybacteria bacterium CG10_big_fil_rev_8_21_14_0_10_36_16 TaxID=1975096 RepID=A0A2J0QBV8_9BACT|nr:MAG: 50S ribosomal protein L16 [Candidatus Yanofskybacteria bacterium CG10_big_fil_rev_8_21_14_0_10_36_16]
MLQPKRIKHRKVHKRRFPTIARKGNTLSFGTYGLKALEPSYIKSSQIEAARRTIARYSKRGGKLWIRIFPDKPFTAKGAEVGMGAGAGSLSHFVAAIGAGRMLFEMSGVTEEIAREALRLAGHKLPIKTKFVKK